MWEINWRQENGKKWTKLSNVLALCWTSTVSIWRRGAALRSMSFLASPRRPGGRGRAFLDTNKKRVFGITYKRRTRRVISRPSRSCYLLVAHFHFELDQHHRPQETTAILPVAVIERHYWQATRAEAHHQYLNHKPRGHPSPTSQQNKRVTYILRNEKRQRLITSKKVHVT